jgi:hypothetical protein
MTRLPTAWLLPAAALGAALTIAAGPLGAAWMNFAFKPLTTLLIIAWAWPRGAGEGARRTWLRAGLVLSWFGDVALLWPQEGSFRPRRLPARPPGLHRGLHAQPAPGRQPALLRAVRRRPRPCCHRSAGGAGRRGCRCSGMSALACMAAGRRRLAGDPRRARRWLGVPPSAARCYGIDAAGWNRFVAPCRRPLLISRATGGQLAIAASLQSVQILRRRIE